MFGRRAFLISVVALALGFATLATPARADVRDGAGEFIADLAKQALSILQQDNLSKTERDRAFRAILRKGFALKAIAAFSMRQFWRRATEEQRAEYLPLFEEFVVLTYSARLGSIYNGETLEVVKVSADGKNGARVQSKIVSPDNPRDSIRIDWRLRRPNGQFKVVDVLIEGLSMSLAQRDEFVSIILKNDGKVQALIDTLRSKITKLKADSKLKS